MKKILVLAASAALLVACTSKPGYKITGTVTNPDLNGQYVYLYEYGTSGNPLDSALVESGSFVMTGQQDTPELCVLTFTEDVVTPSTVGPGENDIFSSVFVLENAQMNALLDSVSSVSGSHENEAFKIYSHGIEALNKDIAPLVEKSKNFEKLAEQDKKELQHLYNVYFKKRLELAKNYIDNNLHKLTGGYLFSQYCSFMGEEEQNGYILNSDSTFQSVPGIDKINKRLEVLKKVAIGQKFTDFTLNTPEGKPMKLSDYAGKGKYVLVDFWASWCPPCRKDMPFVVDAYKMYNKKGFEIVGVSLDQSKDDWTKAIKQMHMTWPQLSDLNGWQSQVAALYGINSIPQTILINPEGIIIAKGIEGKDLEAKLKELLK